MSANMFRRAVAAVAVGVAVLGIAGPGLTQAAPPPGPTPSATAQGGETNSADGRRRMAAIQEEIAWQLARQPDGRQVAPNKIVWDKQGVELTLPMPGEDMAAMANCAYRLVCLFGDSDYNNGPDVQPWVLGFYACTQRDLGDWGKRNQMTSWDNNQTYGTQAWIFQYRDESHPEYGLVQLLMAPAPHQNPLVYPNDAADVIRPC